MLFFICQYFLFIVKAVFYFFLWGFVIEHSDVKLLALEISVGYLSVKLVNLDHGKFGVFLVLQMLNGVFLFFHYMLCIVL